ncbi:hypothetical protein [Nannocystis bainbridge]|uniref:Uncharacterized protein n=1 Tax=Nannocystis bainbridge TaxID=2995303 RepID=A0ABT5E8W9_9BACT|nr:hypothetical protein [Nannocystis bainbridge]MDC0722306.1 hypothetical protein [Nannocystis bainbridge]
MFGHFGDNHQRHGYVHCRGLAAAAAALVLLGCPGGGGDGETEAAPSSSDDTGETGGTSETGGPADPPTSTSSTSGTDTTSPETTVTATSVDPGSTTDTTGEPPVDACHLADDNVACDPLVDRSGDIAVSHEHLYPHATLLAAPDQPTALEACDIYAQDCPEGQKCTVIGAQWDALACVPLTQFPRQRGEFCGTEDDGDTCDAGLLCQFDAMVGSQVCQPLCGCSQTNPTCGENERCVLYNSWILPKCERLCDPLDLSTCGAGEVCIKGQWVNDFFCEVDLSGATGEFGDACDKGNGCDPGYSCEAPEYVPGGCPDGAIACCTPMCNLGDPQCPDGTECRDYFGGFGLAPAQCLDDVGFCTVEAMSRVERTELPWTR